MFLMMMALLVMMMMMIRISIDELAMFYSLTKVFKIQLIVDYLY